MRPESGVEISPLTLGCATFGGVGSLPDLVGRGENRESAFAVMDGAWAGGIRAFDTADAYGAGISEAWIGEWMRTTGNRPFITTKTYNPMPPVGDSGLSRERILRQVASSLERLSVDAIDLYLTHEYDDLTPVEETFATLQELVDRRVVGAYGVSNISATQLEAVLKVCRPRLVQNSYSLLDRRDEAELIPLAREHGIWYQAYSPLAGGWLSGKYRSGNQAPENSRLALVPQWYEHIDPARAFEALGQARELAEQLETSVPALAYGWLLHQPHVTGIVIGPRKVEHLAPAFAARDDPLDAPVADRLAAIFA